MRLLECKPDGDLVFHESTRENVPAYAILSHTWLANNNEEVSFQDVEVGTGKSKAGWRTIQFCADKAAADGLQYFWIDTHKALIFRDADGAFLSWGEST